MSDDAEPSLPVALVGLGQIALSAHLPALLRHPIAYPALLVDPDPGRRELAARQAPGARCADDVAAVLDDPQIRAVVLATPPWITCGLAGRLLAADRYVLAEKPIAPSSADAQPLLDLPEQQRNRLQIGLTYRHDPAIGQLRSWIAAGRLGAPLLVRAHIYDERHDARDAEHAARITATLAHGTPAVHEGAHVFDWLRVLLGDPVAVEDAWAVTTDPGLPAPNLTGARVSYPAGTTALVEFGWFTDRLPRCELSFLGSRGYAVLDGFTFDLTLDTDAGSEHVTFPGERTVRSFDRQLDVFVALVRGRDTVANPGLDDALASLRIGERMAELS